MSWFFIALIGPLVHSVANYIDKKNGTRPYYPPEAELESHLVNNQVLGRIWPHKDKRKS